MTTTDWTTKQQQLNALFRAFYELFSYENDLRLKRIEDKLDQVLHQRVRPWMAQTVAKSAKATNQPVKEDSGEKVPFLTGDGYIRRAQILKYYVPVSQATWWRWIQEGRAPRPVKFGSVAMWRCEDVRAFLEAVPEREKRMNRPKWAQDGKE
jgi:predicted DNA-binding transcriptional regulator AlpA